MNLCTEPECCEYGKPAARTCACNSDQRLEFAIELALSALKAADDRQPLDKDEETGWRNDELCEAYQVLHGFYRARWSALSATLGRADGNPPQ